MEQQQGGAPVTATEEEGRDDPRGKAEDGSQDRGRESSNPRVYLIGLALREMDDRPGDNMRGGQIHQGKMRIYYDGKEYTTASAFDRS